MLGKHVSEADIKMSAIIRQYLLQVGYFLHSHLLAYYDAHLQLYPFLVTFVV
jgi:hypothetical protein